ncbi:MAG: hypothetical protein NUW24_12720, partial [Anaerolineae bacterium]|nr:hypothetical protein [Anaerolineae bacterium]
PGSGRSSGRPLWDKPAPKLKRTRLPPQAPKVAKFAQLYYNDFEKLQAPVVYYHRGFGKDAKGGQ